MKASEFIIELKKESKPRNFVAKNAKMGGAGQHKDKKKAEKQGDVKHKKTTMPMETALRDKEDYQAKRKALDDLGRNKDVDQKAVQQRRLDLDKEAKQKGVAENDLKELSTEKLAQYKKAAGADAKKADADGNYARGDKRFSGINKATSKQFDNDLKKHGQQGVAEGEKQLSVQQLATISDEALDKAYGYGRSSPGNTFGWQANLKSAAYAKQMIDKGVTDIDEISNAIHKGWNVTAKAFVQDPDQFDDTEKLKAAGKLEAKLQQREKLMNISYSQLPDDEQEKDRVVARALLQAIKGAE